MKPKKIYDPLQRKEREIKTVLNDLLNIGDHVELPYDQIAEACNYINDLEKDVKELEFLLKHNQGIRFLKEEVIRHKLAIAALSKHCSRKSFIQIMSRLEITGMDILDWK